MKIYMPMWQAASGSLYLLDGSADERFILAWDDDDDGWNENEEPGSSLTVFFTFEEARAAFRSPVGGYYSVLEIDLETGECS